MSFAKYKELDEIIVAHFKSIVFLPYQLNEEVPNVSKRHKYYK